MTEEIAGFSVVDRHLPHGDHWPDGTPTGEQTPKRVVVHAMAYQIDYKGERLYAATFLERMGLSAHLLIAPDGTPIRCRGDREIAWHAKGFNQDSLGVEVLVPDVYNYDAFLTGIDDPWVRKRQYITTVAAVRDWCNEWGIAPERGTLDRHSDIDPERKSDPGQGFPWERMVHRVQEGTR